MSAWRTSVTFVSIVGLAIHAANQSKKRSLVTGMSKIVAPKLAYQKSATLPLSLWMKAK